jgi:hypothetical protein
LIVSSKTPFPGIPLFLAETSYSAGATDISTILGKVIKLRGALGRFAASPSNKWSVWLCNLTNIHSSRLTQSEMRQHRGGLLANGTNRRTSHKPQT